MHTKNQSQSVQKQLMSAARPPIVNPFLVLNSLVLSQWNFTMFVIRLRAFKTTGCVLTVQF